MIFVLILALDLLQEIPRGGEHLFDSSYLMLAPHCHKPLEHYPQTNHPLI